MNNLGNIHDFIEENNYGGLISVDNDFFQTTEMPIEEDVKVEKKPQIRTWNWKKAIGRALMSGYHTDYILDKYAFLISNSPNKEKILKYIQTNDGLLGYIFIDSSLFDDTFNYNNVPDGMKKYNLYAIHSPNAKEIIETTVKNENNGTMDGFLNTEDTIVKNTSYEDEATKLPVIISMSDVDDDKIRRIGKKLLDDGRIGIKDYDVFRNTDKLVFLKKMFRNNKPYIQTNIKTEDDVSDFDLVPQEMDVNIKLQKDVDIDDLTENDYNDFEIKSQDMNVDLAESGFKSENMDIEENGNESNDGNEKAFDSIVIVKKATQDVDEEEYFAPEDGEEIEIDKIPEEQKISNKYEFGW